MATEGTVISDVAEVITEETDLPWLSPGLIDLQVNGFAGADVNGPAVTAEVVVEMVRALARSGTACVVPTVITAPEADILRSLRAIAAARDADPRVRAAVPYVHLEGPHLSTQDGPRGVHPKEHIRAPDLAEYRRWQEASDGLVGMVTLSPHYPEAVPYTASLVRDGTLVAIGHTHASAEEIHAVAEAGATLSTHLGNGAHALIQRHPNYIWAQLADDRLTASFIGDGHHLPGDTLTAMLRAKGLDRSVLVSDSVALAGMPAGEYTTPVGGRVVLSGDGRLGEFGTPYLAGAALPLLDCVARVRGLAGIGLADALTMATSNPARFVVPKLARPDAQPGRIVPGARADLLLLDDIDGGHSLHVREVIVGGNPVGD